MLPMDVNRLALPARPALPAVHATWFTITLLLLPLESVCCSGDEVLCGMLADGAGKDPFVQLAALLHNMPESQVGALAAQRSQQVYWQDSRSYACLLLVSPAGRLDAYVKQAAWHCALCVPPQVTADLRHSSKENVYALLYGMGPARLADKLGITDREAAELRQALLAALPGVQAWMGRVLEECERTAELAGSGWGSGWACQAVKATLFAI
jgi:hypothetical protein